MDNILKARNQLRKTATRQKNPQIARVIVLAFVGSNQGSIGFDWQSAQKAIIDELKDANDISAIAVLHFVSTHRSEKLIAESWEEILDDLVKMALSPVIPRFIVIHNAWKDEHIDELDAEAFYDDKSIQFSPI